MKKTIYLAAFLAWISGVAGATLALANYVTAPIIAAQAAKAEAENLQKIFVDTPTDQFAAVDFKAEGNNPIVSIFKAGEDGYAYKATSAGYKSNITIMIGIDTSGVVKGYSVLSNDDTPGIGDRINGDEMSNRIVGKAIGEKVDALSGATFSSKGVLNSLEAIATHYSENFK